MTFLKKLAPWHYFLFVVITLYVINHLKGSTYVGIDNISPFWGITPILEQIKHNSDFFTFGPTLFSWWFFALQFIGISAAAISSVYVYGYLFLGLLGYYKLITSIREKSPNILAFIVIFFSSLVPLWVYSTHELMFMSAFVSFPWIFLWISRNKQWTTMNSFITMVIFIPMFLSSSINLVVFAMSTGMIVVFLLVTQKVRLESLVRVLFLLILFIISTQILLFATRGKVTIFSEFINHQSFISQSTDMKQISEDLQNSERTHSSITNAMRFATGWLSIFDDKQNYIFSWAQTYRKSVGIALVQLGTVFIALFISFKNKSLSRWMFLYILGALLLSPIGLTVLSYFPLIGVIFRSASTKLWQLLFIPYLLLLLAMFDTQKIRDSKVVFGLLLVLTLIPAFPWYLGQLYNSNNAPNIPNEYPQFYGALKPTESVLILPPPQVRYFRKYHWGYYGSDLVSYMSSALIFDGTSVSSVSRTYNRELKEILECNITESIKQHILIFETPSTNLDYCLNLTSKRSCFVNKEFTYCLPEILVSI